MGHLINPIALRVGWFLNWSDVYFIKFKYYPEYFNSILRLRTLLDFILCSNSVESQGFFYSHFTIFQVFASHLISIYIYDSQDAWYKIRFKEMLWDTLKQFQKTNFFYYKGFNDQVYIDYNTLNKQQHVDRQYSNLQNAAETWKFLEYFFIFCYFSDKPPVIPGSFLQKSIFFNFIKNFKLARWSKLIKGAVPLLRPLKTMSDYPIFSSKSKEFLKILNELNCGKSLWEVEALDQDKLAIFNKYKLGRSFLYVLKLALPEEANRIHFLKAETWVFLLKKVFPEFKTYWDFKWTFLQQITEIVESEDFYSRIKMAKIFCVLPKLLSKSKYQIFRVFLTVFYYFKQLRPVDERFSNFCICIKPKNVKSKNVRILGLMKGRGLSNGSILETNSSKFKRNVCTKVKNFRILNFSKFSLIFKKISSLLAELNLNFPGNVNIELMPVSKLFTFPSLIVLRKYTKINFKFVKINLIEPERNLVNKYQKEFIKLNKFGGLWNRLSVFGTNLLRNVDVLGSILSFFHYESKFNLLLRLRLRSRGYRKIKKWVWSHKHCWWLQTHFSWKKHKRLLVKFNSKYRKIKKLSYAFYTLDKKHNLIEILPESHSMVSNVSQSIVSLAMETKFPTWTNVSDSLLKLFVDKFISDGLIKVKDVTPAKIIEWTEAIKLSILNLRRFASDEVISRDINWAIFFLFLLIFLKKGKRFNRFMLIDLVSFLKFTKPFFLHFSMLLNYLLINLNIGFLKFRFYLITNDHVTGKFLSRFIALKLKQGYSLRELIKPIKRDLNFVRRKTSKRKHVKFTLHEDSRNYISTLRYRKGLFLYFLKILNIWYNLYAVQLYLQDFFTWMTLDIFVFLKWLILLKSLYFVTEIKTKIALAVVYFSRRNYFSLLNRHVLELKESFSYIFKKRSIKRQIPLSFFCEYIFDDFVVAFESLCLWKNYSNLYFEDKIFYAQNIFFKHLITYTGHNYNYSWLFEYYNYNKKRLRTKAFKIEAGLLGFKFHCLGRFSRKERASSEWFIQGKVPLNTLKAHIDYGFWTVPLKNSSISIKVWLYKAKGFPTFNKII